MSSERPASTSTSTPEAASVPALPEVTSFLFAPQPRASLRADLLGSTSLASGVVASPRIAQPGKPRTGA